MYELFPGLTDGPLDLSLELSCKMFFEHQKSVLEVILHFVCDLQISVLQLLFCDNLGLFTSQDENILHKHTQHIICLRNVGTVKIG
jgi:hypothetical protein